MSSIPPQLPPYDYLHQQPRSLQRHTQQQSYESMAAVNLTTATTSSLIQHHQVRQQHASSNDPVESTSSSTRAEDCRDYLRTGRCKYGASCKYLHPANVQSGGGMRAPIDPSEPLFPLRPNEPICQYFFKHGTCKFGQSCKFNHPPEARQQPAQLHGNSNNNGGHHHHQVKRNNASNDITGNHAGFNSADDAMLQFLPQRPEEPDCIYFLKNGRCKYGATCRYHHPVHYHKRRAEESRRQQFIQTHDLKKLHHHEHGYSSQHHHQSSSSQFGNGYVSDPLLSSYYDGGSNHNSNTSNNSSSSLVPPGLQPVSVILGPDKMAYNGGNAAPNNGNNKNNSNSAVPTMPSTEHGSSTSSIASSYDTAPAAAAGMGDHFAADVWNRSRRNGSGNSLAAFDSSASSGRGGSSANINGRGTFRGSGGGGHLTQSTSETNIAGLYHQRHSHRPASFGNEHELHQHQQQQQHMSRSGSVGSWRDIRSQNNISSSYHHQQGASHQEQLHHHHHIPGTPEQQPRMVHRVSPSRGGGNSRQQQPRGDEGFISMTSALLTMLDTPEEASTDGCYSDEDNRHPQQHVQHRYPMSPPNRTMMAQAAASAASPLPMMDRLSLKDSPSSGDAESWQGPPSTSWSQHHLERTSNNGISHQEASISSHQHHPPPPQNGHLDSRPSSDSGSYFP